MAVKAARASKTLSLLQRSSAHPAVGKSQAEMYSILFTAMLANEARVFGMGLNAFAQLRNIRFSYDSRTGELSQYENRLRNADNPSVLLQAGRENRNKEFLKESTQELLEAPGAEGNAARALFSKAKKEALDAGMTQKEARKVGYNAVLESILPLLETEDSTKDVLPAKNQAEKDVYLVAKNETRARGLSEIESQRAGRSTLNEWRQTAEERKQKTRAEKVQQIKNLEPVPVVPGETLNQEDMEAALKTFGQRENKIDHRIVKLPNATVGKIWGHQEFKVSTIVDYLPTLFETSIPAWSELEILKAGHKVHLNFAGYHHYVNKFIVGTDEYFIRFTVSEEKAKPEKRENNYLHSTAVSDVIIYKTNNNKASNVSGHTPGIKKPSPFADKRLQDFFDSVNPQNANQSQTEDTAKAAPAKPWTADFPKVTQLSTIAKMKQDKEYSAAKGGDREAAAQLIRNIMGEGAKKETPKQKKIRTLMEKHPDAILLPIRAEEKAGRNKIPIMLAEYIAEKTGLEIDVDIVQTEKVGRTGSDAWYRMANRVKFGGKVQQGGKYILIDDVVARGGTFSDLRYYIESHGGEVVDMVSVGAGLFSTNIVLSEKSRLALEERYGVESLRNFLKEKEVGLYGGEYGALTESEARTLLAAGSLDAARDRILAARSERRSHLREGSLQGRETVQQTDESTSSKAALFWAALLLVRNKEKNTTRTGKTSVASSISVGIWKPS